MRYVLFATSRFGALSLRGLVERGMPPVALVTNPDRPAGRDRVLTPPPSKLVAAELGIPVLQPERLPEAYDELRALGADVFVVASYGKILRPELMAIPPRGVVGIHPSLLPLYRGPSPIQTALLDGATETGVALFVVEQEVDHGPVFAERKLRILPGDTHLELEARLADLGSRLAVESLPGWVDGSLDAVEQDHARATFTSKFSTQDAFVSWDELKAALVDEALARSIANKVAALNPEPGTWTERAGVRIKLLTATTDGGIKITSYQLAGKKPVSGVLEIV